MAHITKNSTRSFRVIMGNKSDNNDPLNGLLRGDSTLVYQAAGRNRIASNGNVQMRRRISSRRRMRRTFFRSTSTDGYNRRLMGSLADSKKVWPNELNGTFRCGQSSRGKANGQVSLCFMGLTRTWEGWGWDGWVEQQLWIGCARYLARLSLSYKIYTIK